MGLGVIVDAAPVGADAGIGLDGGCVTGIIGAGCGLTSATLVSAVTDAWVRYHSMRFSSAFTFSSRARWSSSRRLFWRIAKNHTPKTARSKKNSIVWQGYLRPIVERK